MCAVIWHREVANNLLLHATNQAARLGADRLQVEREVQAGLKSLGMHPSAIAWSFSTTSGGVAILSSKVVMRIPGISLAPATAVTLSAEAVVE